MKPRKDGCDQDEPWPIVDCETFEEAFNLGGDRVTYELADGTEITFGTSIIAYKRASP